MNHKFANQLNAKFCTPKLDTKLLGCRSSGGKGNSRKLHQYQGEEYEADGSCCSNEEIGIHSTHQDMQLTIPSEPATAVSIAINTLRSFPKLKLVLTSDILV